MSLRLDHAPIAKAGSPTDRGYGAFFRAELTPPVATDCKCRRRENGSNRLIGNRRQPTAPFRAEPSMSPRTSPPTQQVGRNALTPSYDTLHVGT
jgi:hypothetical protein